MNIISGRNNLSRTLSCLLFVCTLLAAMPANAATPKVKTVAGGYLGDGKPATSASLAWPSYIVRDKKGNLYISDGSNCRIRKVNAKGIISTVVGKGLCGYSGDGGPARTALIFFPRGVAVDSHGNLLFADSENFRVRKVTAGTITTVAGNGTYGYSGDGGPATQASLGSPRGIAVDASGNIFIADSNNYVVRMVDTSGIIHTVAGNHTSGFSGDGGPATSAQLSYAEGLAVDNQGDFYIADYGRVRKVDSNGIITTYAGNASCGNTGSGGPATSAAICGPFGLLLAGNVLYIGTQSNIWAVDLTTQVINLVAGNPNGTSGFNGDGNPALSTSFNYAWGIAADPAGDLLVVDQYNNRVRKIDPSQTVTTIAGGYIGDGGAATAASVTLGGHIGFDPSGNLYIADSFSNRVRKVSPAGMISTVAGTGLTGYSGDGGPAVKATLSYPAAVAADGNGNVFIADEGNGVIRKIDSTGTITTLLSSFPGAGGASANGLAIDSAGNLYAAAGFDGVWTITASGSATRVAGNFCLGYNGDGIPALQACIFPTGIAFDSAGNFYISDSFNNRIRKVDTAGIIWTVAGDGNGGYSGDGGPATQAMLYAPSDVALDTKGNLYIADYFRVRVVNTSGTIQTLAGTGGLGYNGNGLPATSTNLFPSGVATSPKGVVYVSDYGSSRVRKVQ